MRTLRLARIAAEAEGLRLRHVAQRTAGRAAAGIVALVFLTGAVAFAQVPTGAHYPSDIIAGSAIGAAASGALNLMWRALRRSRARRGKRPVA